MAGTLDKASQRRSKLLEEHKVVKTQLQTLDKAATAAAAKAPSVGDISPPDSPRHEASDEDKGASAANSGAEGGSDDDRPADAEGRKAAAAERQRQQRTLHQRRKAICMELDRTKEAVRGRDFVSDPNLDPDADHDPAVS